MEELKRAIKQTNCGRAPGKDGIPVELYKALSEQSLEAFYDVLISIWSDEEMPDDLRDATIVTLDKIKAHVWTAITTEASPCFPLLAKYLLASCSTG